MPDNSKIEIRSEAVQEILTAVPNWMIRWGNTLILSLILLLLIISWFVKYPDIIITQAVVTTETPPEKIYARTSGKIQHLLVNDRSIIKAGTPLAIIENPAVYEDVYFLKSIIDTIHHEKTHFDFPIDQIPILFLGSIESDFTLFENAYLQYRLNKKLKPYENEKRANVSSIKQMKNRLTALQNQKELNRVELSFKEKDLQRYETLFEKGVISAQEFENKQRDFLQAQRNFSSLSLSISQLEEAIQMGYKTANSTEISKIRDEISLLKSVIQSFNQLKKAIKDWELQYVLKANMGGKVTFLNVWNENQYVRSGDLVFTVVPQGQSNFIAKLKAPIRNSGKIKRGQKVHIKLDNYPDDEFGVLNGEIASISSIPDLEGFYHIDALLPDKMITSYNKKIDFRQEMTGTGEIVTEDLRLIERFFYQLKNAIDR
jgi:multidrug resistance efflux pump